MSRALEAVSALDDRYPKAWFALREGIETGVAPSFVVGVWRPEFKSTFHGFAIGQTRLDEKAKPVTLDTMYDFASVSKIVGVSTAIARLRDRGYLEFNQNVTSILPEWKIMGAEKVTVAHLLAHTSGLPAWSPFFETLKSQFRDESIALVSIETRQKLMQKLVLETPLEAAPGERALYSDLSFLILGFLIERLTGHPLDVAVKSLVLEPWDLSTAHYRRVDHKASDVQLENVAATETCPWRKTTLQGQVHDDNTWAMGGYAGHAGLFGRVHDLMQFGWEWLHQGVSAETRLLAWTKVAPPIGPVGCERTLGWDTPSLPLESSATGGGFSAQSVGHLGFSGTSLWIEPETNLIVTLLSNRVHPTRENVKIKAFRSRFHRALREDLDG